MKKKIRPFRFLAATARHGFKKRTLRYLLVGGSVYIFELWVILIAQHRGATPTQAVAISFTLGLIVSFFLQKLVTFGDKRMHRRIVLRQALAVGLLVIWNLYFTVLLTKILQSILPPTVTRTIALLITTIWNFYFYKTRIFTGQISSKVAAERPGVLLDIKSKVFRNAQFSVPTPKLAIIDDRRHSLQVVVLCSLILAILLTNGWMVSTVRHSILKNSQAATAPAQRPQPLFIDGLTVPGCRGHTVLQVVAHADDDLAFINPDVKAAIDAGKCIRTVYLTAADHGWGIGYAEDREIGIRMAYNVMLGIAGKWKERTLSLPEGQPLHVYDSPEDIPRASAIFLRLPDGNLNGEGFSSTGGISLTKLLEGTDSIVTSINNEASYTKHALLMNLVQLIAVYQPVEIRTLGDVPADVPADHKDHVAAGMLATSALKMYRITYQDSTAIPILKYVGYPIAGRPSNLSETQQAEKTAAFFTYAQYDHNVCKTMESCESSGSSYAKYMSRRYIVALP